MTYSPDALAEDEVLFWLGQQEREHLTLASLALQDARLRAETLRLLESFDAAARTRDARALVALATPSQALKRAALEATQSGLWVGWLPPSYYSHAVSEIDYALALASRTATPRDVVCFWARERSEEAALVGKMLDPTATGPSGEALRHHALLRDLQAACRRAGGVDLAPVVRRAVGEMGRFLTSTSTSRVPGILHPMLAEHAAREGARGEAALAAVEARLRTT